MNETWVYLDDGSFRVPARYVEAIGEEYDARGRLSVSEAAILIDKWDKSK